MSIFLIKFRNDFKMALATYVDEPKIKPLFALKPFVTIFMTNEEKRSYV